jgi:perosamine synthetase
LTMIPISRPQIGEEEERAVLEVLHSGQLAQGPRVREFEEAFAAFCGTKYAVAVSSGTTALLTSLLAHRIGLGHEVITSPFTFIASANSILFTGARPVFVDIDEESYNIDPDFVERRITERTRAIMPVHLYGYPCDMESITEIADAHELVVIEDACQAHGAAIRGKKVGSFGTGCFSFYPSKNMTTAEGGMITTDDEQMAEQARLIRNHGQSQLYFHEALGYNFRMTELQAALGEVQLRKLPQWNEQRRQNAAYLSTRLKNVITPKVREGYDHVFHQYTVRIPQDRDGALQRLNERGIGARVYYPLPVHQQPLYLKLGFEESLPEAEQASREVLSLPVHPSLSAEELDKIVSEVSRL